MKIRITKESFIIRSLFIINIITWQILNDLRISQSLIIILDFWILLCYIVMLYCIRKACGAANYISAWLLLSLPFYFSQVLFYYYNRDIGYLDNIRSIFNGIFSDYTIIKTVFFTLSCLLVLCFAAIESYDRSQRRMNIDDNEIEINSEAEDNLDLHYMRKIGGALFIISLFPMMYYWMYAGIIGRTLGYAEMKAINATASRSSLIFICSLVSGWFLPSAYMLLISTKSNIIRRFVELMLIIVAFLIFRAGSRYKVIEMLVAYILIDRYWLNRDGKADYKKYIAVAGVVYVVSTIIRLNRTGNSFTGLSSLSLLSSILGDSGSTSMINCAALEFIPDKLEYGYGISFLYGIAAILPAALRTALFPGFQTDITGDTLTKLSGVTWSSFGSSIIAESYYNFGIFSLVLMALYGVLLGKIVFIQRNKIGQLSPCKFIVYVYLCSELIFAIRSEFSSCFRSVVYYVLIPVALIKILKSFTQNRIY